MAQDDSRISTIEAVVAKAADHAYLAAGPKAPGFPSKSMVSTARKDLENVVIRFGLPMPDAVSLQFYTGLISLDYDCSMLVKLAGAGQWAVYYIQDEKVVHKNVDLPADVDFAAGKLRSKPQVSSTVN